MKKELIDQRKKELENARKELKLYFVGLDEIIDEIISKISPWYIMPDLVNRPLVICLWGMTGVGKTDLVRRLVKHLNFQDRFEEVQMTIDNSKALSIESSISDNENIEFGKPYVLLLDEIQRFRSVEIDGQENHSSSFKDVWDLLSDGKLTPEVDLNTLFSMVFSYKKYDNIRKDKSKLEEDETPEDYLDYRFEGDYYSAKRLKKLLKLNESYEEIIKMDPEKKFKILIEAIESKSIYEHKDYTKGLIFISGNIDEAYNVASSTDDVDYDADLYHKLTKKINIIDIKRALKRRFKPEQIARFGNNNIIYPSMSRESFETLIDRKCNQIAERISTQTGITVNIDPTVKELIYNNGVFPVQGTRPLFSTITDIIERNALEFIYQITSGNCNIKCYTMSYQNNTLYAVNHDKGLDETPLSIPYIGDIDKIRQKNRKNKDKKYAIAVHEAGHAALYAILFGVAPPQVIALTTNDYAEGYMSLHSMSDTYSMLMKTIQVVYGGAAAEEMVFGKAHRSAGAYGDVNKATSTAGSIIRKYAMTDAKCEYISNDDDELGNQNFDETNDELKKICAEAYDAALVTLDKNKEVYKAIVNSLLTTEVLSSEDFVKICGDNGLDIKVVDSEDTLYDNLEVYYNKWLNS